MKLIAIAAAALAAALLLCEGGLRAAKVGAPTWYKPDPQLGWSLRAHKRGREGRSYVWINPSGQRDHERSLDKPEGVYRIAVLGDGYSEAIPLALDQTWWWQLPGKLERCGFQPGKKVEALNFGVAGYGTAQEYVMLESTAMRYQPDLVLLQFANRDDVMDNSFALATEKERPFFMLDERGVLRIDDSFATSPPFERRAQFRYELATEIADHSRILQVARKGLPIVGDAHANQGSASQVLAPPRDRVWEEAWRVTEALIAKTRDYAARNGARLAVVTVPHPQQMQQDRSYPDQRLEAFGGRQGISVITLAPQMRQSSEKPYSPNGDWTPAGHRLAAEVIAQGLCAQK